MFLPPLQDSPALPPNPTLATGVVSSSSLTSMALGLGAVPAIVVRYSSRVLLGS